MSNEELTKEEKQALKEAKKLEKQKEIEAEQVALDREEILKQKAELERQRVEIEKQREELEVEKNLGSVKAQERELLIQTIQKKKPELRSGAEKQVLDRELKLRAKYNSTSMTRDIDKLMPSQMTIDEMKQFCEKNDIECKKGDTTTKLRMRIKAFRNPGTEERLLMIESRQLQGRIIK